MSEHHHKRHDHCCCHKRTHGVVFVAFLFFLIVLLAVTVALLVIFYRSPSRAEVKGCPVGWFGPETSSEPPAYCYLLYRNDENRNWVESEEYCRSLGGFLATFHSIPERNLVLGRWQQLDWTKYNSLFVGIFGAANRSAWLWVDTLAPVDPAILTFAHAQPDNFRGTEYCGRLYAPPVLPSTSWNVSAPLLDDIWCHLSPASGDWFGIQSAIACKMKL